MSTLSVRLPGSLHRGVKELAKREGVSMNQIIATAVAEKLSALMTEDYLEERAARGNRERFEAVLEKVPDVEPDERDRLD
ncbi:MAG: toxin-antitoxin system HicB family antitoxin [Myxococcota bacterium]